MKAIRATVHGAVQGVGFRYAARSTAARLGVLGWVRNLPDGSVQVWAQGAAGAVDEFVAFLEHGSRGSVVRSVDLVDVDPDVTVVGFEITF